MMSEGSTRLPATRLKRKKIEKRCRSITSERDIAPGVIRALDAHRKSVRLVRRLLKDIENELVVEENYFLLEQMTTIVRRDMKVLKNLILSFGRWKDMKKMIKLKVEGEEEDQAHEGEEGGEAKPEEEEGGSGDDASRLCADFMEDEEEDEEVDIGDDESDSSDTDNDALKLRKSIREDDYEYCPRGEDKVDYIKLARYFKQVRQSEGFDIDDFLGIRISGGIVPLRNLEKNKKHYLEMINLATNALNAFNSEKGKRYEFHKLVSVNSQVVAGFMYYVTFEARNPEDAYATRTFQTKICCGVSKEAEVQLCRIKKS